VPTLTFNDEAEQTAVAIVLRSGNRPATRGAHGLLRALVRRLRRESPGATLRVRVDGGFAGNDWLDVLETHGVEYVVGLASHAGLVQRAGRLWGEPMACPNTVAAPSASMARPSMRPGVGHIGAE